MTRERLPRIAAASLVAVSMGSLLAGCDKTPASVATCNVLDADSPKWGAASELSKEEAARAANILMGGVVILKLGTTGPVTCDKDSSVVVGQVVKVAEHERLAGSEEKCAALEVVKTDPPQPASSPAITVACPAKPSG